MLNTCRVQEYTPQKIGVVTKLIHKLTPTIGLSSVASQLGRLCRSENSGALKINVHQEGVALWGVTLPDSQALGERLSRVGIGSFEISQEGWHQIDHYLRMMVKCSAAISKEAPSSEELENEINTPAVVGYSRSDAAFIKDNLDTVRWICKITGHDYVRPTLFPKLREVVELIKRHGRRPFEEAAELCSDISIPNSDSCELDLLFRWDLAALAEVIDRFGMGPFLTIARNDLKDRNEYPHASTGVLKTLSEITDLIQAHGIEVFVELSDILGPDRTDLVFGMLKHLRHLITSRADLIEVCTILKTIDKKSGEHSFGILQGYDGACGLLAILPKIKTKADLINYGDRLARISSLPHGDSIISRGICNFEKLITSPESLTEVGEALSRIAVGAEKPRDPISSRCRQ